MPLSTFPFMAPRTLFPAISVAPMVDDNGNVSGSSPHDPCRSWPAV